MRSCLQRYSRSVHTFRSPFIPILQASMIEAHSDYADSKTMMLLSDRPMLQR